MPRTNTHKNREEEQKQTFAYTIFDDGGLMSVGNSRKHDCQTINDIRGNGDLTPVNRYPLGDMIKTEYGFMTRAAYLEIKNNQK
jgi:hypothetical protein